MYLVLILLPLLGSITAGFFGIFIGTKGAQIITSISLLITTLLSIVLFIEVGLNNIPVSISLFR
jgi:NADH:ubiquinone oxidoreductase subunit 5 (subunit L)/multisubunit Na+/H+ antiporter MnhA subunit